MSIFEPINNYFPDDMSEFWGFDAAPVRDLVEKIWVAEGWTDDFKRNDPMMNFTERDLVRMAGRRASRSRSMQPSCRARASAGSVCRLPHARTRL